MILSTKVLAGMVNQVISDDKSSVMQITMSIYSATNPEFSIDNCLIDTLFVSKRFDKNTTNERQLVFSIYPTKVVELVKHQAELFASMIIEYIEPVNGEIIYSEPPEVDTFRVFLHNPDELTKRYESKLLHNEVGTTDKLSGVNANTETLIEVSAQLMTLDEYRINKAHYHGMLSDTTIESAIAFIASRLGVTKLNMITPDNKAIYKHINIPPEQGGFGQVFEYLQRQYGIYSKGMSYYVDNETLFIYPAYELESPRLPNLTILKVGVGAYSGASTYHKLDGKNITIVTNSKITQQTLSGASAENDGNSQLFLKADALVDGQIDHDTMQVKNTCVVASSRHDNSIQRTSAVARYSSPAINLFHKVSKMAAGNCELISLGWNYSRMRLIEPGMPCSYIFDEKQSLMLKRGIVELIEYHTVRSARKGSNYSYSTIASIVIRSEIGQKNFAG